MRKRALLTAGLITLVACFEQDPKNESGEAGGRSSSGGGEAVAGDNGAPEPGEGGRTNSTRGGRSGSGGLSAVSGNPAIAGSPPRVTGAACENDEDCVALDGGPGRCDTTWPSGYCASICATFLDCTGGEGAVCREIEEESRCLTGCFAPSDCREGYRCDEELYGCIPE
jgi:hypothetical protein